MFVFLLSTFNAGFSSSISLSLPLLLFISYLAIIMFSLRYSVATQYCGPLGWRPFSLVSLIVPVWRQLAVRSNKKSNKNHNKITTKYPQALQVKKKQQKLGNGSVEAELLLLLLLLPAYQRYAQISHTLCRERHFLNLSLANRCCCCCLHTAAPPRRMSYFWSLLSLAGLHRLSFAVHWLCSSMIGLIISTSHRIWRLQVFIKENQAPVCHS